MQQSTDILISGGGAAGLAAAATFGTLGFDVTVVDPAPPVSDAGAEGADHRTTAILQPGADTLRRAGLWERLAPHATPLEIMRIVDASQDPPVSRDFAATDIADGPWGWNVPNVALRRALVDRLDALPTVDFRAGTGFASMVARLDTALVRLTDGTTVSARLVIGADGRDSPVRAAAGIEADTRRYGQKAIVFAVTHDGPHNGISTEIHREGGPFTLVPLPDLDGKPRSSIVWMDDGPRISQLARMDEAAFAAALNDRSAGVMGPLVPTGPRAVWPIVTRTARRVTARRTALIAEAAHVMPPIGAQGLNTSLKDLAVLSDLADRYRDRLGEPPMLDAYVRARHGDVAIRSIGIDLLNRTSQAGHGPLQDLRALGLRVLHDATPLRRTLMRLGSGIDPR